MPVSVHGAVRLHVGDRRKRAIGKIREQIGDVAHVIGHHGRIVRLIFERVADVAVAAVEGLLVPSALKPPP